MPPAKSVNQRTASAIAKHAPDKLYPRNRGLLKMSKDQLGDFAKGLPKKGKKKKKKAHWSDSIK